MPKRWLRRVLPNREKLDENAFMRRFGHWFSDARLWHLNRRGVAIGVAVGVFAGLIPGPLQIIAATLLALFFRVNLPIAMAATFYTNPFTIAPLYWLAYQLGVLLSGGSGQLALPALPSLFELGLSEWMHAMASWIWSLGTPLAIGLPVLALLLAAVSYVLADLLWRLHVRWAWRQHCLRGAARRRQ